MTFRSASGRGRRIGRTSVPPFVFLTLQSCRRGTQVKGARSGETRTLGRVTTFNERADGGREWYGHHNDAELDLRYSACDDV